MNELVFLLASWPLAGLMVRPRIFRKKLGSVGLPLAYFVGIALNNWAGASLYLVDGYYYYDPQVVLKGFRLTTFGLWTFCVGVVIARYWIGSKQVSSPAMDKLRTRISQKTLEQLAVLLFAVGLITQLIIMPLIGPVATLTAVLSGLSSLTVVGVCLGIWHALLTHNKNRLRIWLLIAFSFPFITLTNNAFLGYGVHRLIVILAFVFSFIKVGAKQVVLLLVMTYLGLSFFVVYLNERDELREMTWQHKAGYGEKVAKVGDMFLEFELFDPGNEEHLNAIDRRLNQNHLVGLAIINLESNRREFAGGKTLWFSLVALIPRAIWPGKPVVGGGGSIVSEYTGLVFSRGTSVGVGQVFEFYINFGISGVIFGFLIFGFVIGLCDLKAAISLRTGNYRSFIIWFLPGIAFLQAGGNIVEITTSVGSSIGSAILAIHIGQRYLRSRSIRRQYPLS